MMDEQGYATYEITLRVTINAVEYGTPDGWDWSELLDLGYGESVEVVR